MKDSLQKVNISHINTTVLEVSLKLNEETVRNSLGKYSIEEMLNLTWYTVAFQQSSLLLQVIFDHPVLIGQLAQYPDYILVEVIDHSFFRDKTGTK